MSAFFYWLEQRAQEWIARGEKRIPVRTQGNVGWGNAGVLTADSNQNNAVSLQVGFGPQMQTHTIQFDGPDNTVDLGPGIVPVPQAEILWQVNGIVIRRLVTVFDGMAISGEAQSVTVNVRDRTLGGNGAQYTVGITVAPGPRGNIQQPPVLVPRGVTAAGSEFQGFISLVAGDFAHFLIPQNCGAVNTFLVLRIANGENLGSVTLEYRAVNLGIFMVADGNSRYLWVPLVPGIERITIRNNTANTINAAMFIGIEG